MKKKEEVNKYVYRSHCNLLNVRVYKIFLLSTEYQEKYGKSKKALLFSKKKLDYRRNFLFPGASWLTFINQLVQMVVTPKCSSGCINIS